MERRLSEQGYCLIVVAEGAGQDLVQQDETIFKDASGNLKLPDIGLWLKDQIVSTLAKAGIDTTLK